MDALSVWMENASHMNPTEIINYSYKHSLKLNLNSIKFGLFLPMFIV